jgi:hypothetical protein
MASILYMANEVLFFTSIICGAAILCFFEFCGRVPRHSIEICIEGPFIYGLFIFGIITSVLNHGTTSIIAKWLDRITMLVSGCVMALVYELYILIIGVSVIYFVSKFCSDHIQTLLHCLVHIMATVLVIYFFIPNMN